MWGNSEAKPRREAYTLLVVVWCWSWRVSARRRGGERGREGLTNRVVEGGWRGTQTVGELKSWGNSNSKSGGTQNKTTRFVSINDAAVIPFPGPADLFRSFLCAFAASISRNALCRRRAVCEETCHDQVVVVLYRAADCRHVAIQAIHGQWEPRIGRGGLALSRRFSFKVSHFAAIFPKAFCFSFRSHKQR